MGNELLYKLRECTNYIELEGAILSLGFVNRVSLKSRYLIASLEA